MVDHFGICMYIKVINKKICEYRSNAWGLRIYSSHEINCYVADRIVEYTTNIVRGTVEAKFGYGIRYMLYLHVYAITHTDTLCASYDNYLCTYVCRCKWVTINRQPWR